MTVDEFATRLRGVRSLRTQREFGLEIGVDTMRISRWERGACAPSVKFWRVLNERWPDVFPLDERPASHDDSGEHARTGTEG